MRRGGIEPPSPAWIAGMLTGCTTSALFLGIFPVREESQGLDLHQNVLTCCQPRDFSATQAQEKTPI